MQLNMDNLKLAMARNKLSVTELAVIYGVSRARMNVILKQREVTPVCAGRLAEALNVDVNEIIII